MSIIIVILVALILIVFAFKQTTPATGQEPPNDSIVVVCSSCNSDLLMAKTNGIQEAMRQLVTLIGDGSLPVNPAVSAITFHLDGDSQCGQYQSGLTGNFSLDATGMGHVCLWDVEKDNRSIPFTVENASKIEDQLLPVHEAMHGWFVGRQENYRIQEPFCKLISFMISKFPGGPEYCNWFSLVPDGHPDILMKYLCEIGMTSQLGVDVLRQLAQSATTKGVALSDIEFSWTGFTPSISFGRYLVLT
jgi:hypothetical protein